jgi:hypothetical protein
MGEHERARPRVVILETQLRRNSIGRVGRQGERTYGQRARDNYP